MNADPNGEFLRELCQHHISGQLKVAPEHCAPAVLKRMGKPSIAVYNKIAKSFYAATKRVGKEQYLVPYLMSSHPGSTMAEAVELALWLKENRIRPEQVQDFYPTPGTASTCMFYTSIDPYTMEHVYVPTDPYEKKLQRTLLQYYKPENRRLVIEALIRAGREDLIGHGPGCLVQPDREYLERVRKKAPAPGAARGRTSKAGGGAPRRGTKSSSDKRRKRP